MDLFLARDLVGPVFFIFCAVVVAMVVVFLDGNIALNTRTDVVPAHTVGLRVYMSHSDAARSISTGL